MVKRKGKKGKKGKEEKIYCVREDYEIAGAVPSAVSNSCSPFCFRGRSCVNDVVPGLAVLRDEVPVGDGIMGAEPVPGLGGVRSSQCVDNVDGDEGDRGFDEAEGAVYVVCFRPTHWAGAGHPRECE